MEDTIDFIFAGSIGIKPRTPENARMFEDAVQNMGQQKGDDRIRNTKKATKRKGGATMGKSEIEGYAKRKVKCDIAELRITFYAHGVNSPELQKKVMDECDDFLENAFKLPIRPEDVRFDEDSISTGYQNKNEADAERTIHITTPFDMKLLNRIQTVLQNGKYAYTMSVDGNISYRHQLLAELSQEALNNSKEIAEKLAESQGLKVKGIKAIRKDRWDDEEDNPLSHGDWGSVASLGLDYDEDMRPSDRIEAKYISEDVRLKITWNLE